MSKWSKQEPKSSCSGLVVADQGVSLCTTVKEEPDDVESNQLEQDYSGVTTNVAQSTYPVSDTHDASEACAWADQQIVSFIKQEPHGIAFNKLVQTSASYAISEVKDTNSVQNISDHEIFHCIKQEPHGIELNQQEQMYIVTGSSEAFSHSMTYETEPYMNQTSIEEQDISAENGIYIKGLNILEHNYCIQEQGNCFKTDDHIFTKRTFNIPENQDISGSGIIVDRKMAIEKLKRIIADKISPPFFCNLQDDCIQLIEMYPSSGNASVKWNVTIDKDFKAKIYIHGNELSPCHELWLGLPIKFYNVENIQQLLAELNSFNICSGCYEENYLEMVPVRGTLGHGTKSESCRWYIKQDEGAIKSKYSYFSALCNSNCLLLTKGIICYQCFNLQNSIRRHEKRLLEKGSIKETIGSNYMSISYKLNETKDELRKKIRQQGNVIKHLQQQMAKNHGPTRICPKKWMVL